MHQRALVPPWLILVLKSHVQSARLVHRLALRPMSETKLCAKCFMVMNYGGLQHAPLCILVSHVEFINRACRI